MVMLQLATWSTNAKCSESCLAMNDMLVKL